MLDVKSQWMIIQLTPFSAAMERRLMTLTMLVTSSA